jgi:LuxR family transcriptional regulator, maltose regulon positive regulatory protein
LRRSRAQQIPELHLRAANWYERQGLLAEAVSHALAAPAYQQAMRLIEQAPLSMLDQERGTLRQWIEALPSEQLKHRPRLCLTYAALLVASLDFEATETYLQLAECSLQGAPEGEETMAVQQMLGEIDSLRADLACDRGEIAEAIALCRQALAGLPRDHALLRGKLTLTLGVAYVYQGEIEAAQQALTEAVDLSQAAGNLYGMIQALYRLGWMHMFAGNICLAYSSYQHALHIVETHPAYSRSPYASLLSIFAGGILAEWNELDPAAQMLSAGIALAEQIALEPISLEVGYTLLAGVRQVQGRMEEAEVLMQHVEQIAQQHNTKVLLEARIVSYRVSLWIAQGKLDAAIQWAERYRSRLKSESSLSYFSEIEGLALAEVLLAQSRAGRQWPSASPLEEALQVLEQVRQVAEDGRRMGHLLEACVLEALIQQAQGHGEQALGTLKKVLRLAEPEGYVRLFVDKGPPMTQLLQQVAASGGASPYLARLLEAAGIPGREKKDPHFPQSDAAFPWLEALSEREVEVLRLLASGASNTEMAQALMVSTNTVRTHLRHIYDKLGASNRTQAVARARELHLLSS